MWLAGVFLDVVGRKDKFGDKAIREKLLILHKVWDRTQSWNGKIWRADKVH